jgi:excinuclease ABC subunit C
MTGKNNVHIKNLKEKMSTASAEQDYETAAKYRDNIQALETVASKSAVVLSDDVDTDVFGLASDELSAAVQLFIVREGRIRGVHSWNVDTELDVSTSELVDNMLRTAYDNEEIPPRDIIVPELPEDAQALATWLSEIRRERLGDDRAASVKLKVAQRGDLAALASTVKHNAQQALILYKTKRRADYVTRTKALSDVQEALGLPESPLRIECFDVSHLGGTKIVASMVVFEDGLSKKSDYRKFSIAHARDDTDAMNQVLTRRAAYLTGQDVDTEKKASSFSYPPGLFVVDGALPQVNAAAKALEEAGLSHIPVVGLAKRLEELWLPGEKFPVILPRNSEALFLFQQLRDEAHRFAITFQRASRKRDINTVLSEVPGMGPAKVKAVLAQFGSVAQLRKASVEEISRTPQISPAIAQAIKDTLSKR